MYHIIYFMFIVFFKFSFSEFSNINFLSLLSYEKLKVENWRRDIKENIFNIGLCLRLT